MGAFFNTNPDNGNDADFYLYGDGKSESVAEVIAPALAPNTVSGRFRRQLFGGDTVPIT